MNKGQIVRIVKEVVVVGGVVNSAEQRAKVVRSSGNNITVESELGFVYEINRHIRDENGAYIILG